MARKPGQRDLIRRLPAAGLCLGVLLVLASWTSPSLAQPRPAPPAGPSTQAPTQVQQREALRDSLRQEIRQYHVMIEQLRDSLSVEGRLESSQEWLEELELVAGDLSDAIGTITEQLAELQLEVDAGQVSLRDRHGGRVTLDLPTDLGDRISQGIASITRVILDEIPDTLRVHESLSGLTWNQDDQNQDRWWPTQRRPERTIEGDLFKFNDDLEVAVDEVVLGDVVTIFGDVRVLGRIEGDLVTVLGDVHLGERAAIDGEVTVVLGQLTRLDQARTGSVTVINPGEGLLLRGTGHQTGGWSAFWIWQALFVLVLSLVLLMVALVPRLRLDTVVETLHQRGAASLGLGVLLAMVLHVGVILLGAILVLTVIGIPVALVLLVALLLLDLMALGAASLRLGQGLCSALNLGCPHPLGATLAGLLALHAVAFLAALASASGLPMPLVLLLAWTGNILKILALFAGLGALFLSRLGTHQNPSIPTTVSPLSPEASLD